MKKKLIFITTLLLLCSIPFHVLAHGLNLTLEEPGVLKAEYDGGGFSPRMEVTLYDKDGNELEKGKVDDKGEYHFDPDLEVQSAVVEDGMGHRAEYEKGVEQVKIPKLPVVIIVFILVGGILYYYNKKKK
ncbi:MAG: hypothetical protein Q4Q07_02915 [Tissierellia bacterium]|nr:hypothetical protein [Tissierellia bacterium]